MITTTPATTTLTCNGCGVVLAKGRNGAIARRCAPADASPASPGAGMRGRDWCAACAPAARRRWPPETRQRLAADRRQQARAHRYEIELRAPGASARHVAEGMNLPTCVVLAVLVPWHKRAGLDHARIAQRLGVSRRTVERYSRT